MGIKTPSEILKKYKLFCKCDQLKGECESHQDTVDRWSHSLSVGVQAPCETSKLRKSDQLVV